jgi:PAS domain S-box-containing protein
MGLQMVRRHWLGLAVAMALQLAPSAVSQEYGFRVYGSADGLRNVVVLSLAQDHAGYVWVGTEGGLYRYDGTHFRLIAQAEGLPCSAEVHGLFVARDGALWANTCSGIFRFDGHRFLAVEGIHGLIRGAQVMADAADGAVLIATPTGIYAASSRADGSFRAQLYQLPSWLAGKKMHGIQRQGERIWFGCGVQLCLEQAGHISLFGKEQGLPEDTWDGIQTSPDGTVWVRSPKSVYRRAPGQVRFSQQNADIASSGFWGAIALTRDGSVMVPTDQGLAVYGKAKWSLVNRQRGLRNENTVAVLEDREDSVWIGLAGGGLARWLGRNIWESWKMDQGLLSDSVWNIRRDRRGELWVGTTRGLTRLDRLGRARNWTEKDGLGGDNVRWLAESSDGSMWAALKPGGLARIDPVSGKVRHIGAGDGLACDPEDLFVDRRGRLWLPTTCGLFLNEQPWSSNRVIRVNTPERFGRSAWKVLEDTQGIIWVSNGQALWSLKEGNWREHRRAEGLLTDNPYVMALARDGSIWLRHRYDAGVDRLQLSGDSIVGAVPVVPASLNAASGTAFHGFDAFGNFWRGTANGVDVLHGNTWTAFTMEDGLVSNDCDGEAFWADTDGGVWLGTSGGLAHYLPGNAAPPGPAIADPTIVRLQIDQQARLIQVEFSTLNYKAEQLAQFAYRLDHGPWIDSLERHISITGAEPGAHRLEVRSRARDGPFSPRVAAAEFRVAPRWNETWWARVLAFACVLLAIAVFVRWRLRAASRTQQELEALVAARTTNLIIANRALDNTTRELRESENRLKNAERLAHVGHWDWNIKTNEFSWSEEIFRIFEVQRLQTNGYAGFLQAVMPHDRKRLKQWVNACLANNVGESIEFQITRPNGDTRILNCTSEVSTDEEGRSARFFGACQDITDSRRAQQEDFSRKKLESVGILAGGIAHDFNNILGGVLAQAELALEESGAGLYPYAALTAIQNVAIRGSEIVRQLMIYAGKESEVPGLIDVSQIVVETFELLKLSLSKRVSLVTDLGSNLPPVWASPAHIRQIAMNLVTNASDAIGDQAGLVRVSTRHIRPGCPQVMAKGLPEGHYLLLEVSDTGCGMSMETQGKVFDPFFSTRGAGHGLGLAVVHGIVRSLHGAISIASEPGNGTMFQVWLPCEETSTQTLDDRMSVVDETPLRPQQFAVLVVEDEDPLRQAVLGMLRKVGFSTLGAADGAAAIELLRANPGIIDLVLLDLTIPGASSNDVLAEVAQARPGVRVVLTSAYSQEMMSSMNGPQVRGFIRKPYRLGDLVQTLQKVAAS